MAGRVESIAIAPVAQADLIDLEEVEALTGRGLVGDRYCRGEATSDHQAAITLIERAAYDHLASLGLEVKEPLLRRNIVVTGIELNPLVGQEFLIGNVRCRASELCEPCSYIEGRTHDGVLKALVGRGGIRAGIVEGGVIRVGDPVTIV